MGIKNLNVLLKKYVREGIVVKNLDTFSGKIVAIDISIYLYKFKYGGGNYLKKFLDQIMNFWKHGITPVYIFDGMPPSEKCETLHKRKVIKQKTESDIISLADIIIQQKNLFDKKQIELRFSSDEERTEELSVELSNIKNKLKKHETTLKKKQKSYINITIQDINNCKNLFNILGIKYIVSNSEADILCCELLQSNIVDYCMSEDMDFLTHGCNRLLKNYDYKTNTINVYLLDTILQELDVTFENFVDICILCGCDYTNKINGIGPINALKYIKKYNSIEKIIENLINGKTKAKNKLKIQDNFNYIRAREIFFTKTTPPLDKEDLFVGRTNYDILSEFFGENKIKYNINKVKSYRNSLYKPRNF
jgi:flap endonuclease-1